MTINANAPASQTAVQYRWAEEDDDHIASAMAGVALNIERYSWQRRILSLVCTRYMTGRDVSTVYAYSMAKRPASLAARLRNIDWTPPHDNVIATIGDTYAARLWKQHPFIVVVPIAGNFKAYVKAKQLGRFIDAVFYDTKFWDTYEQCGDDAVMVGDAFVKVHESATQSKKIAITRVLADEILVNEEEALYGNMRSMIQRCFMHVEELIALYGKTKELRDKIWKAPRAQAGLYYGDLNVQDIVPFLEGWHLKGWNSKTDKEDPGKKVVSINNVLLSRTDWGKNHFPFARLQFKRLPNGYFSQGLVEQLLPYQAELNRYDEADWENQKRMSYPTVMNPTGSGVSASMLGGGSGRIINYNPIAGQKPTFEFPDATNQLAEIRRARIRNNAFQRARIDENTTAEQHPSGVNSGTALMMYQTMKDSAHADLGQRGETFVTDIGMLVTELAEDLEPKVMLPGRNVIEIDWKDIKLSKDSYHARAFPMSSLPQLPAARQQKIDNWYANGNITKEIKMRLEQVPDVDGYADLVNAALDDVFAVLDCIIEDGEYNPPEPFEDLGTALAIAQSRYLQEKTRKHTPEDRLDLLLTWIMQADELIAEGAGPVGIQSPAGAPAAPPTQTVPAQAAPQQLSA